MSMIESIEALLKLGGNGLKNVLLCIYSVLSSPQAFFNSLREDDEDQFVQASIFACFISILNLVIILPVQRILHVGVESPAYLVIDTVLTYLFMFLGGSIYHGIAKLLGGHASYRDTVSTFLYLTAFQPFIALVLLPFLLVVQREMMSGAYPLASEPITRAALATIKNPVAIASLISTLSVFVYFFITSITALSIVHKIGRLRSCLIAVFGLLAYQAMAVVLEIPLMQLLWQAFKNEGKV